MTVTVRRWMWALTAMAVVVALAGPAGADPGRGAESGPGSGPGGGPSPARMAVPVGKTYRVTLLTGDVVTVTGRASGCAAVSVKPAAASGVLTRHCDPDGHVRVIPSAVAPLIGSVLDPDLFDVTTLVGNGYDDARSADLPLIVRSGGAPAARAAAAPLTASLTARRDLPSISAVAGRSPKAGGPALIRTLTAPAASARATAPRVWLDRRVRASALSAVDLGKLDANLRQVSAPQAWAAGATGAGARVAVLDTGADVTHPDLAGRVTARADFTVDGGDAVDRHGHGTHVAATVAGSGSGSGGERRGIAPDAALLVGKVLDDSGSGSDSQVIAGMEWAATRADVVNLSLGGVEASDGTDPLSQALDALTAQTGALFVVAAGNSGSFGRDVAAPAAAASALTVGAVDGTDTVAAFSTRGPVTISGAAKPEIVAPGVDIVAARAAGTTLGRAIDDRYVATSGTSMAAPHVAGAAALLVGRHPDWSAAQVKAALVGAVDPARTTDVYTVGAGRLDAAAGVDGVVAGQGVVNLGRQTHGSPLSWTNTGTRPADVTLDVAVTDHAGRPAPDARLSTTRLALAAGTTGTATVTVDRNAVPGFYTALVTARGRDGAVRARTPVTFEIEAPTHELTFATGPLPGGADGLLIIQVNNLDDPALHLGGVAVPAGDTATIRVAAGRYSVLATFGLFGSGGGAGILGDPDVDVRSDTTVTIDPARGRRVTATVEGTGTEAASLSVGVDQRGAQGPSFGASVWAWGEAARTGTIYAEPNDGVAIGTYAVHASFGLTAPGSYYDVVHTWRSGIPADPTHHVTAAEKDRMARVEQRFHRIGAPSTFARSALGPDGWYVVDSATTDLPPTRTDYLTPGFVWQDQVFYGDGIVTQEPYRMLTSGSRQTKTWARQPIHSDWYDDPGESYSWCAPEPPRRTRGVMSVHLVTLTDRHQRFDCPPLDGMTQALRLTRDGVPVGSAQSNVAEFAVPSGAGVYRLAFDVTPGPALAAPARISSEWTFHSTGPAGTGTAPLPLLSVDYELPLDADNRPVAGGTAVFDVRQALGVRPQRITRFRLWTSVDDGASWQPVDVTEQDGRYRATLPHPAAGQAISIRVSADGAAGSRIDQTVIAAVRA